MKKAQTATEYLIILCVVIIVALVVLGVMGGFRTPQPMPKDICTQTNGTPLYYISGNFATCRCNLSDNSSGIYSYYSNGCK